MKIGIRTPSIKKSVKARTTGRITREVKSSINPTYGKKGMGWVKDPQKAAYNKVYNKTTVGVNPMSDDDNKVTAGDMLKGIGYFLETLGSLLIAIGYLAITIFILYIVIQLIF